MDDPRGVESSAIMVEAAPEPRRPSKRQSLVQFFTGAKAEAAPPKRHSKTSVLEMWGVIDEAEAHMTRRKQTHRTSFFVREPGETPDWLDGRRLSVRHEHDPTFSIEDDFGEGGEDDVHSTRRALPRHLLDDGFVIPSFDAAGLADVSEAPVGRGSQAAVFRCRVPFGRRAGETFALKVLRKELAFLDDECAAFVREVHFLGRIRHEHVCETLGCGTTRDNLPCLLLSWCETDVTRALELREVGGDDGAARRVRLAWPSLERLRLLSEFASALDFLHSGAAIPATVVLHRDLKPDNLGLTDAGQLKLLDFGLAVALRKDTNRATGRYELTGGTGSRRYMAPEICRDLPYGVAARVAADVYSFAVVAFEVAALAGRPFREYSRKEHAARVVERGARPPIPQTWKAPFRSLLAQAWHPDQDDRCTMSHARAVLDGVLAVAGDDEDPLLPPPPERGCACAVM
ncbi:hypothetical protein AURANDRAFT_65151 [Aureococcus anophagefferens]|uniref:Protein kinase domain-containing protein n=1 Tax=Aureococcus anophagefferens TaxID=44056 RepID=F0YCV9_AURAN|nr:hypothetical protein AURANDRAFT_65151 [Aureococcus anophagefferens]EGB07111.1 hypothetical protein AURANDRAFT_65151 [Aureococcus anophagefferens]|eukprot:XP_009038342.1 hypothetical protein AURANDRAFT_65151 [Aureococcus anophagefferens]